MPREPKKIRRWGIWPLIKDEILEFVKNWPEDFMILECTLSGPLLMAATRPELVGKTAETGSLRNELCTLYSEHPDFVLALLALIRKRLSDERTDLWLITKYLRLHPEAGQLDAKDLVAAIQKETGFVVSSDTIRKARRMLAKQDQKER